jgi:hypothetical protein
MEGKTTRSPITAVIIIIALNMPKLIVGTNLLNINTPKPIQSISDDKSIALPFRKITVLIDSGLSGTLELIFSCKTRHQAYRMLIQ